MKYPASTAKSLIYRFYAQFPAKPFIYRIYAFAPGVGGRTSISCIQLLRLFTQNLEGCVPFAFDFLLPCFQGFTNPFFSKPFIFTSMQIPGGVPTDRHPFPFWLACIQSSRRPRMAAYETYGIHRRS
jgi:hypothetical protein